VGRLDDFEERIEHVMDGAAGAMFKSPLNPVQIMRRAEKEMNREKLVSAGRQYAPTLYNVMVNVDDDRKLAGFYPTLAGEMETALKGKAGEAGLQMDGAPLVRFIVDDGLRRGRFDVIAENVAAPIVAQLREDEMERYGIASPGYGQPDPFGDQPFAAAPAAQPRYAEPAQGFAPEPPDPYADAAYAPEPYADAAYAPDPYADAAYAPDPYADADPYAGADPYAPEPPAMEEGFGGPMAAAYAPSPAVQPAASPMPAPAPMAGIAAQQGAPAYDRVPGTVSIDRGPAAPLLVNIRTGERYPLSGMRLSLGRERNNNIAIRDANVSRSHAELVNEGGRWTIRDLGSTNGTQVNDHPVSQSELFDGDTITVGMTVLEFREG